MSKPLNNLCSHCQKAFDKSEDWEIKLKEKILENCERSEKCYDKNTMTVGREHLHRDYRHFPNITQFEHCKTCQKKTKATTSNCWGDKLEETVSNGCQCHKEDKPQQRERERERESNYWIISNPIISNPLL